MREGLGHFLARARELQHAIEIVLRGCDGGGQQHGDEYA